MGFICSAQVMKPLYILLLFVIPYTLIAFIWWYVYSASVIWSDAGLACSNWDKIQFATNSLTSTYGSLWSNAWSGNADEAK